MTRWTLKLTFAGILLVTAMRAQQTSPDVILSNGKIITVDERFTIAQTVAIKGDRIVAVGTTADINRLAGPNTRRIDLRGRSLMPGLIDNHMHVVRAGGTWQWEVRWDGVATRKEALDLLRARTKAVKPGEWIYNLGGWAIDQFSDDRHPFTREELDHAAPDNPVLLQASYYETYLNSRAIKALGVDAPTGRVDEPGIRTLAAKLPVQPAMEIEASTAGMIKDLNRMGLTAVGSAGCETDFPPIYMRWAAQGKLNVRVFCIDGVNTGTTPEDVARALPQIAQMKLFQGNNYLDHIFFGESVYGPLHDPMFLIKSNPGPDQLVLWRRIATEIAK